MSIHVFSSKRSFIFSRKGDFYLVVLNNGCNITVMLHHSLPFLSFIRCCTFILLA
ncbi:conserved hypothetical protein [Priestia megaterium]|uniref:Uncharacterized protein n=1 Tax=Priestia megaterium (strain ATCC 12872 / QMB1551) TaxID=545693 RepID=D5DYV1_PRIM1|nr:hypothetical protein BMQ_0536 [Priestia megaterium QM B1551]